MAGPMSPLGQKKVPQNYAGNTNNKGIASSPGIYVGVVKRNDDSQNMGRLQVWVEEFGGDPDEESAWISVSYASPFGGSTSIYEQGTNVKEYSDTMKSYGFWAVPPDLEARVLIGFAAGKLDKGYWFACLFQRGTQVSIPGIPAKNTWSGENKPAAPKNKKDSDADLENIVVLHSINLILNTAASTHVDRSYTHFNEFIHDNVNCVSALMDTMVSLKKLNYQVKVIHLSTDEVYGDNYETVRFESDMLNPTNPYSASKASGDMIINSYCNSYNLFEDILVLRPNNMAGCFQYPDKVIPLFIDKILKNETISIHGDGEQKRCFISTEFVSEIIFTLFSISHLWDNELFYNVGFNDQSGLSVNDLYNTIKYTLLEIHCIKSIDNLKSPIYLGLFCF